MKKEETEITLINQEIKQPLEIVKGGVENNSNITILSYVLIETKDQILTLTTTNKEIEIVASNNIKAKNEIKFTLCFADLINIISKFKETDKINFKIQKQSVLIEINKNTFKLNTINHQDFNKLEINKEEKIKLKIDQKIFKKLINNTKFSIAIDNPHNSLNGLLFEINKNKITTVATDGHRLSKQYEEINSNFKDKKSALIPKKAIDEIGRFLNIDDKNYPYDSIHISNNYFTIRGENIKITSRLLENNYPNYKEIMPQIFEHKIIINTKKLYQSLKQAAIFTNSKDTNSIKLNFKNTQLKITSESEKGQADIQTTIENFNGELTLGFNVNYLIQALDRIKTTTTHFNVEKEKKMIMITNNDNDNYKHIVMVVKI